MNIAVILLAAGIGSRFKKSMHAEEDTETVNKLFAKVDGQPMYGIALEKLRRLSVTGPKVVVSSNACILEAAKAQQCIAIENNNPMLGIASSVTLGMQAVTAWPDRVDAVLFMVCDQPYLSLDTLTQMTKAYRSHILALCCRGKRGNPVIFSSIYFNELMQLKGDVGGRQVMKAHEADIQDWIIENPDELRDIDYKEDLL